MRKPVIKGLSRSSIVSRRQVLGFMGGTAVVSLLGCSHQRSVASQPAPLQPGTTPACVVKPQHTEGPFFVDARLNRSDIRSEPSDGSIKAGIPLQLVFQVSQISSDRCIPLTGAIVDIWQCDAQGVYSDVNGRVSNTVGKAFLRGYQTTDANGTAQFMTIYPGYYPGRAVHIHFKIRTESPSQPGYEFTSQLYFDDALTDQVYEESPYGAGRRTLNSQDGIFRNGGEQLVLQLTPAEEGYMAHFAIALEEI